MRTIGAAVVGTGFIGPVHVEAIRRLGHRVVGVLGSSPAKSAAAADRMQLDKGYADLDELLADPAVDVVHLASPNADHFGQCQRVLAAGKHVVCEKPLAMNSAETAELVALADSRPLVAAVNYNIRFYPLVLDARERLRAGLVGSLFHVSGAYLQDWLLLPTDFNWRVTADAGGPLRAVADIGTHWLDTIQFITGLEIEAVCADLATVHEHRYRPEGGSETFTGSAGGHRDAVEAVPVTTDDCGHILLRFRGGAKGALTVSQVMAGRKNALSFELAGSKQGLWWQSEEPNVLHVGHRHLPNEALGRDPGLLAPAIRRYADYPGGHAEGFPDTFKQLYKAVYADIAARLAGEAPAAEPLYATFADGHREARLCEAILRSHREERWVRLSEPEA